VKKSKTRALIIILIDVMLTAAVVLLFQIDRLVNATLYDYGLVFSREWAEPYWIMLRMSLALVLVAIFVISVLELPHPAFEDKQI
jgi:cbb3-type cytochrome oxidase subunit 1